MQLDGTDQGWNQALPPEREETMARIGRLHPEDQASAALARELGGLRIRHEELRQRLLELQAELEARTRRLHQLIGERDQLASLMRGRDDEIRQLNREVGAGRSRSPEPGRWLSVLRGALERFPSARREAPADPRAVVADPTSGDSPLVPWIKEGSPRPVLCAVVTGLPPSEIEGILEVVECQCRERRMAPLVLTSDDDFQGFQGRRLVVEYLPSEGALRAAVPDRPVDLYLLRRLALIRQKWQPERIVAFGPNASEMVRRWQDSPFENDPIPALIAQDHAISRR